MTIPCGQRNSFLPRHTGNGTHGHNSSSLRPRRLGEISLLDDNDTDFTMESGEWKGEEASKGKAINMVCNDVDFCLQYTRQLTRKPSNNPNPSRKG
ncbi:hypothetical protein BLNAU_23267 [Blattamonas nauphoetae]|uniref:Uncharacterized protein n=1 Tax=Blattamonas nauphoetae TaxID=2049346 RepID=A0ABQ9WQP4_9EUKA|nr:hypothetical protein BLNAU_23267 [Blattamonas nauphoetae]